MIRNGPCADWLRLGELKLTLHWIAQTEKTHGCINKTIHTQCITLLQSPCSQEIQSFQQSIKDRFPMSESSLFDQHSHPYPHHRIVINELTADKALTSDSSSSGIHALSFNNFNESSTPTPNTSPAIQEQTFKSVQALSPPAFLPCSYRPYPLARSTILRTAPHGMVSS